MGKENQALQAWQAASGNILSTRLDKRTGRRILLPLVAAIGVSFLSACRQQTREVSLVGDAPAGPPPEPNFNLENEPSLQSVEDIVARLIQSTFRPRYQGVFAPDSTATGVQVLRQTLQRVGILPNFNPTPAAIRNYTHYTTHPTYIGNIKGDEFSGNQPAPGVITYANYNISFAPDNTWSSFSIRGGSSLDKIPEISSSIQKKSKPNGDTVYEMAPAKLIQAGDLLVVLPRNAQRVYLPKTPGNLSASDGWEVRGVFQPDSVSTSVRFNIYKDRGFWSLELTRPHHTPPPQ